MSYDIDELTTDPIYIPNIETVELSYNKRQSVLSGDREALQTDAHQNLLYRWFCEGETFDTTGGAREPHTSDTASGTRKKMTKATLLTLMTRFNMDNVPAEGRYVLLDSCMYADLLEDLTEKELSAFLASANAQQGIVGRLYGFDVMQRSQVLRLTPAKKLLEWSEESVAGELAAGLAWQENCVSRAMGEVKMFDDTDNPLYYGDIYSFLMRVGGAPRRYDKKGIAAIVEAAITSTATE